MEHLNEEQIVSYRTRSLSASEVLRVSDHLVQCEACRVRVSQGAGLTAAAAVVRARLTSEDEACSHLTYEEIAGYVDGAIAGGDAARVNQHVRECAGCAADLRELRALKAEIGGQQERASWWSGFWNAVHGWNGVFALAAAAACLLIIGVALRPRASGPVAHVAPPPSQTPETAPGTVLVDGDSKITISAQGAVAGLEGLPDPLRAAVETALTTQRLVTPAAIAGLAAKRDVLLGAPSPHQGTQVLEPVGIIVEAPNVLFRWKPLDGAEYQVSVYTSDFQQAAVSGWIRESQWRTPVPLRRGGRYSWQLTVRREGREFTSPAPPEPEARFQVLDAKSEAQLTAMRSTWEHSHLVMGIAYAQAGLLKQAGQELQAAADQNPGSPTIAGLLASINSNQHRSK